MSGIAKFQNTISTQYNAVMQAETCSADLNFVWVLAPLSKQARLLLNQYPVCYNNNYYHFPPTEYTAETVMGKWSYNNCLLVIIIALATLS